MCGIAGSVGYELPVQVVMDRLRHRGPDEQQVWVHKNIQFVHARLAIQELSAAGRQPMHHQGSHIIYNGEIYNHQEIRQQYQLACQSHSDTETILQLYEKLGIDMLNALDGMFAMALYDEKRNKLFLIRDRAGEKPLYYSYQQSALMFASELQVLQTLLKPVVDDQRVANFLAVGYLPVHETPYQNVHELPPAHYLELDLGTMVLQVKSWWSISDAFKRKHTQSFEETLHTVDQLLTTSVKRRLVSSDLEVGTFLSGGIDSGLVTAMAARVNPNLKTFTVSFDGAYNEAPLAAQTAKHLGTKHHEINIAMDHLEDDVETIFRNYGEPMMDDSIIPSYYVAREARKHLTVILNGDAGDELFGGYRRYVPFTKLDLFAGRGSSLYRGLLSALPVPGSKMSYYNYGYRLLRLLSTRGIGTYFSATNDLLQDYASSFMVAPDLSRYTMPEVSASITPLQRIMHLDFTYLLPTTLLVKMDIATMASSLEGRSPFLSHELMEYVPALPDAMKVRSGKTKVLLRDLAKQYLPEAIIDEPKRGFEVPLMHWMDGRLRTLLLDYLSPSHAYVKTILKPDIVNSLLNNTHATLKSEQRARILFALLSVECWKKGLTG
jgi:asparagine synthase (glutamine-hydrolysing)